MCGLAGALLLGSASEKDVIEPALRRMCDHMHARGPDAVGYWSDIEAGLALGHRRLSIIDLQPRANQPMISDDGRYVIIFNGEIYNFRELRRSLEHDGEVFRTQSDTEVLLKLYAHEGEAMLSRLRGMFAFAVWDRQTRSVFFARDPYGIKPLYLARSRDGWLFASQVKALLASGLVSHDPDSLGQAGFWLLGSVPEPRTWFREISALPAGCWGRITAEGTFAGPHKYWDIGEFWREASECRLTPGEAQEMVRAAMLDSAAHHLVADVPVGVFLSGGVDSGSLAGLMKDTGASSIRGITIDFSEFKGKHWDEAPMAGEIARRYGVQHHVRRVTRQEFEVDLPRILSAMDQPSVDGINTWYAAKAAAEHGLKVVISGVGGDELFHGYSSFRQVPDLVSGWQRVAAIPGARWMTNLVATQLARSTDNPRWRWLTRQMDSLYGAYWLRRGVFTPDQLPALMGEESAGEVLKDLDIECLLRSMAGTLSSDPAAAVGQLESMVYLRNQLLRDSDWATMDHSVELRTPIVDAWLLRELAPAIRCFSRYSGKTLLARAPLTKLPAIVINRKKTGFGIPIQKWLQEVAPGTEVDGGSRSWARYLVAGYMKEWR